MSAINRARRAPAAVAMGFVTAGLGLGLLALGVEELAHLAAGAPPIPGRLLVDYAVPYALIGLPFGWLVRGRRARRALLVAVPVAWAAVFAVAAARERPLPAPAAPGGPPLLLVVVDTLRADAAAGMPALQALSATSVVYEEAQAASPWTLPSVATLLTGVGPHRHGVGFDSGPPPRFNGLRPEAPGLVTALADQGYTTGALLANVFLRASSGLDRGFAWWHDDGAGHVPWLIRHADRYTRAVSDARFLDGETQADRAIAWMAHQGDGRWFLVVHLMDPHPPHRGDRRLAYADAVARTDRALSRLLAAAPDDAWIVVTADHGLDFDEHDPRDPVPDGTHHGHTLYQELLHVPLVVRPPGGTAPRRISRVVGHADVLPTLLLAAGAPVPPDLDGAPLAEALGLPAPEPRPILSQGILFGRDRIAVRDGPWKLIAGAGRTELYDLEQDPEERDNLVGLRPALAEALLAVTPEAEGPGPVSEADGDVRAQLEALGYLH